MINVSRKNHWKAFSMNPYEYLYLNCTYICYITYKTPIKPKVSLFKFSFRVSIFACHEYMMS